MLTESLIITALGMGGVFFFLFILVCFMNLLRFVCPCDQTKKSDKVALAIAYALQRKGK